VQRPFQQVIEAHCGLPVNVPILGCLNQVRSLNLFKRLIYSGKPDETGAGFCRICEHRKLGCLLENSMLFFDVCSTYNRDGEPIHYHGPHELCFITGGPQNHLILS